MSKVKNLKNYIKSYPEIFNRIIGNYKLNSPSSFLHEYLDYSSDKGSLRIALVSNRMVKVLKQEGDTKVVEIVRLIGEEPTATERIRKELYRENIKRTYRDNKLISLSSTITLNNSTPNESIIEIYLEEGKVVINQRDVSLLYQGDHNDIEGRYDLLKTYYSKEKERKTVHIEEKDTTPKSKRQLIVEEQLRDFIREEFDYKAPLGKRDLDDLLRITDMLIKRRKSAVETQKQYKKI